MGHHFIPQRYLRRFEDPLNPGQIWLHQRGARAAKLVPIKAVAQSRNFYSDDTERWLAQKVERPGNSAIDKLLDGGMLSDEERDALTRYMGIMMTRVPARRRKNEERLPLVLQESLEEARAELELERANPMVDPRIIDAWFEALDDIEARWTAKVPENVVAKLQEPRMGAVVRELISSMAWRVVRSVDERFVTSDNPVFFFDWMGLSAHDAELSMPLSSRASLHGSWQGAHGSLEFVDATDFVVRELNRRTRYGSELLRFSSRPERWLLDAHPSRRGYLNSLPWGVAVTPPPPVRAPSPMPPHWRQAGPAD